MPQTQLRTQPRTLFLHIGIHKTGTSAIQNVCRANHHELLKAGILFPRAGIVVKPRFHPTATSGHSGLLRFLNAPSAPNQTKAGEALLRQIESGSWNRLVLSSEALSAPHKRGPVESVHWFRQQGFEVRLIAYLRRQDGWLDSFYRERLKWDVPQHRDALSIDEFWRAHGDAWLNYKKRIGEWVSVVGREHAEIRSYEDVENARGIVGDFLEIIGADPTRLDLAAGVDLQNPSLPPAAVDLLRAANTFPSSVIPDNSPLVNAVMKTALFTRSKGSLISPALWGELQAAYGDHNEELRTHWINGPSRRFSFREGPQPLPPVQQAISLEDAKILLAGMVRMITVRDTR